MSSAIWPEIPYTAWKETHAALHQWLQIVGKFKLAHTPWVNHSWHATFYLTAHGWTTGLVHCAQQSVQLDFDFIEHQLIARTSEGRSRKLSLEPMSVATFHDRFAALMNELGVGIDFDGRPNEIPDPIPFEHNTEERPYDGDAVHRFWQATLRVEQVLQRFRTGFLGKVSPVHLFWGSFDLAVTRFSGRRAPLHPGGIPALPDDITREAYSHEVSSAGFWAGGGPIEAPAFYSYAYPAPEGFAQAKVGPAEAYFDEAFGEFVLPYDAVRTSKDPEETLLGFLQSTYDAAADLGKWDRAALECPQGRRRVPRPLEA